MNEIEYIKLHIFIYRYKLWLSWIYDIYEMTRSDEYWGNYLVLIL